MFLNVCKFYLNFMVQIRHNYFFIFDNILKYLVHDSDGVGLNFGEGVHLLGILGVRDKNIILPVCIFHQFSTKILKMRCKNEFFFGTFEIMVGDHFEKWYTQLAKPKMWHRSAYLLMVAELY